MELHSAVGRADGVSEEQLNALVQGRLDGAFDPRERAALQYAEAITRNGEVPEALFGVVRAHFNEDEIVELTAAIAFEICAAKFNRALEIEAQGICVLPAPGVSP